MDSNTIKNLLRKIKKVAKNYSTQLHKRGIVRKNAGSVRRFTDTVTGFTERSYLKFSLHDKLL